MIATRTIRLHTGGNTDIVDITEVVIREVAATGLQDGVVVVFAVGSTAAVTTLEYEPGLVADLKEAFDRWAPRNRSYHHNATWNDDNGHSHVRASLIGPSLSLPLVHGRLPLGTWQQLALIDFDIRPRTREIIVQVVGEGGPPTPGGGR